MPEATQDNRRKNLLQLLTRPLARVRSARWALAALALVSLTLVAGACSDDDDGGEQVNDDGNVFANGGFEDGKDAWFALKPPDFELSEAVVHSGSASAALPFREPNEAEGNSIYYLVQEVSPEVFPEYISGSYFVDNWQKGTEKMYLQFVVIVFNSKNLTANYSNHQIRYILSGIKSPPFAIANAGFVFLTREDPVVGEWVDFSRNLADDFREAWGAIPEGFDMIRVLFEVRYDDKLAGEGPIAADVYYDDLYMGPAPADAATSAAQ